MAFPASIMAQLFGKVVRRSAASLPQTTTTTFFNVTGDILLTQMVLEVTTAIQNQACTIKLVFTPTGGAATDLSSTVSIANLAVGQRVTFHGTTDAGAAQAPTTGTFGGMTLLRNPLRLSSGTLGFTTSASNTGAVKATAAYLNPDGGSLRAA